MRVTSLFLSVLLLNVLVSSMAIAATIRVPEHYPTILAGVDAAVAGDSVVVGPGTWTDYEVRQVVLDGVITIASHAFPVGGVTLVSRDGPGVTIIEMDGPGVPAFTGFWVGGRSGVVNIEGFTFTGLDEAEDGVCVVADLSEQVNVRNCRFVGNTNGDLVTFGSGGSSVLIEDCLFLDNTHTTGSRGNMFFNGGDLTIRRCTFSRQRGRILRVSTMGDFIFEDSIVTDCDADGNDSPISIGGGFTPLSIRSNRFERCVGTLGGAFRVGGTGTIEFNVFHSDSAIGLGSGGGFVVRDFVGEVRNNTFVGCYAFVSGGAVAIDAESEVFFEKNIVAASTTENGPAVHVVAGGGLELSCNVFWNNTGGDLLVEPSPTDVFQDPLFCAPTSGDYSVGIGSPASAANSNGCGDIGALGVGCGVVSVEAMSWGRVKGLYR